MKMILILNLWLMMISWCLFLNGYVLVSILVSCVCTAYLLKNLGEVDYRRSALTCIIFHIIMAGLYFRSNIPYYFPGFNSFMICMVINAAICGEYPYHLKRKAFLPILSTVFFAFLGFIFLVIFVPGSDYTIFTKGSLFLMVGFIFLPYLIPMALAYLVKSIQYAESLEKQGA